MSSSDVGSNRLLLTVPMLHVDDMQQALSFYCNKLGFAQVSEYRARPDSPDPAYVVVRRDETGLHLSSFSGDGRPGAVAVIYVADVNALFEELRTRGVAVGDEPMDQTWGNREFYIDDPFGNQLRYIQPGRGLT